MTIALLTASAQVVAADEDGLTWREILSELPHDAASIVILTIVLAAVVVVVWAGRARRPASPADSEARHDR